MKKLLVATVIIVILALSGYLYLHQNSIVTVKTQTVETSSLNKKINASGSLESIKKRTIYAPVSGEITQIYFETRKELKAGDWLVTIKNPVTDEETIVKTPIDGAVFPASATALSDGSIDTGSFVNQGQAIYQAQRREFNFEAMLDETDLNKIKIGNKATVVLDVHSDIEIKGEVSKIENEVTSSQMGDKMIAVTIKFNESLPEPFVYSMSGDVNILTEEKTGVTVPLEALAIDGGNDVIYIIHDNKAIQKSVVIGDIYDDQLELLAGVSVGDRVIIEPLDEISDGTKVEVK